MKVTWILGVKISNIDLTAATEQVRNFLACDRQFTIVTPNPEFIVTAQNNREFKEILNRADLAVPDGIGLRMAAQFLYLPAYRLLPLRVVQLIYRGLSVGLSGLFWPRRLNILPAQVTGVDLMVSLCRLAAREGWTVFFLGGREGVGKKASLVLKKRFAGLRVAGVYEGESGVAFDQETRSAIGAAILQSRVKKIDLLFVAYGHPAQELWVARNIGKLPVRGAMGVGGAFDLVAGRRVRAPVFFRRRGLEWLWRLLLRPRQLPRIFNALIKFPLLVFASKLRRSD